MNANRKTANRQARPAPQAKQLIDESDRLMMNGQLDDAISILNRCIELHPDFYLSHQKLANCLEMKGDLDQAFQERCATIQLNPQFVNPYLRLWGYQLTPEQARHAMKVTHAAFRNQHDLFLIHGTLGHLHTALGEIDEAVSAYQTALMSRCISQHPDCMPKLMDSNLSGGPDFFVIGGMKCGTTSIFSHIVQHPQVLSPLRKEIHFFDVNYRHGIDWYRAHFLPIHKDSGYVTGEASPCMGEIDSCKRLAEAFPRVKMIVILRDPVERAFSHFHHNQKRFGPSGTFESIVDQVDQPDLRDTLLNDESAYRQLPCLYLSFGLYWHLMREWQRVFPMNQFLFLQAETMFENPQGTMDRVFEFLGLKPFKLQKFKRANEGNYSNYAAMDEQTKIRLANFYRPFNSRLNAMIGIGREWNEKYFPAPKLFVADEAPGITAVRHRGAQHAARKAA